MSHRRIGVDLAGDTMRVAIARSESGRPAITRLDQSLQGLLDDSPLAEDDLVSLAVPDSQVMVKTVRLGSTGTVAASDRVRFELIQSLLESEDNFHFDSATTGIPDCYLGLIIRQQHLSEITSRLDLQTVFTQKQPSFQARAMALGRGYLAFGFGLDDRLTVMVDLAGENASICFLYDRHIVDIASLSISGNDLHNDSNCRRFAVDLKTVVNYRQSTLLEAGISVPPSRLLLSGESVDAEVQAAIQALFLAEVTCPRLNEGFFSALDPAMRESLPLYLVALGLTVN